MTVISDDVERLMDLFTDLNDRAGGRTRHQVFAAARYAFSMLWGDLAAPCSYNFDRYTAACDELRARLEI